MRSGGDQRPRGRPYGNRPPQQQGGQQRPQNFSRNGSGHSYGSSDRVRGNPHQLYQRYLALAQDALRSEDRIAAEGYYQHAEHYFRVANAGREDHRSETQPAETPPPIERAVVERAVVEPGVEPGLAPTEPDESEIRIDPTRFC